VESVCCCFVMCRSTGLDVPNMVSLLGCVLWACHVLYHMACMGGLSMYITQVYTTACQRPGLNTRSATPVASFLFVCSACMHSCTASSCWQPVIPCQAWCAVMCHTWVYNHTSTCYFKYQYAVRAGVTRLVFWECLLHVSTFATTRVALPTGVEPG
jgi:hypothetical protein